MGVPFSRCVRAAATTLAILTTLVPVSLAAMPETSAAAATTPTSVIVDTDIYSNTDDEGALAVAFGLQLEGAANVLAIGVNTRTSRPQVATNSWRCAAAITQFYGFPDVPIGSDMPDNGTTVNSPDIVGPCAALASPSTPQPTPAVSLYRRTLAAQPDDSVVMVGVGYEENLANLLASPPDAISPLSGSALIAQKVSELVLMGGGYPSRSGENNLIGNPAAAEAVAAGWPTKVVYSGYEVGYGVFTGHTLSSVHPANSPIRVAYEALVGAGKNNRSFDITALYHALRPSDPLLTEVGPGTNVVDAFGDNVFTAGTGDEYYLTDPNPVALQNTLEGLMDVLPGTSPQAITFTSVNPLNAALGSTYAPSATGGPSGNPVTFAIDPSSTSGCSYDSTTALVTFAAPAGTCVIDADQGGSTVYAAAPRVSQVVATGTGVPQSISFTTTPPTSPEVGDTYAVGATVTSGLPVTISIDSSSTSGCTYAPGTGLVTFSGPAGTCAVDADQAGSSFYAPAPRVAQTIGVGLLPQSISFTTTPPSSPLVGDTYAVGAAATSGLPVAISIDPSSTSGCTYAQGTGLVTFSGAAGTCVVDADQAGSSTYAPAPRVAQSIGVGVLSQSVSFTATPPASPKVGDTYAVGATATSGLPVAISIDPSSTSGCTYAPATGLVTFGGPAGSCVIDADQAGSPSYAAATRVTQATTVVKAPQTIMFTSSPPRSPQVGQSYTVTASASSGLAVAITVDPISSSSCAISGSTVKLLTTGPCELDANQAGSASYLPAAQVQLLEAKGTQTVRFTTTAPSNAQVFGLYAVAASSTAGLPVTVSIDSSSAAVCTYSSATGIVTFTASGTCTIDANQAGTSLYAPAATVQQHVKVAKASQSIAFTTQPPSPAKVGGVYTPKASATSGLAVSLTIDKSSRGVCSISAGTVTFLKRGTCTIDATQSGNGTWAAATEVRQSIALTS